MNSFRLYPKHAFPVAVPTSRACLAAVANPARGGVGLPLGRHSVSPRVSGSGHPVTHGESNHREASVQHRIILADDHAVVRQTLKRILHQQADLQLVGESSNGLETLALVKQLQPDLLVTDLMMPGMNGLEVTRRIRLSFPAIRVLVVSVNGDEPYVAGAFRCGASGFVLKTACGRHLLPAVRAVLAGRCYVSPPLTEPSL